MNFTSINNPLPNALSYQNKATASKTTTMTALLKITIALLLSLLLASCGFDIQIGGMDGFGSGKKGNGIVTNEIRKVNEDFTEITASEGLNVYVTQADDFEISVKADENIIDLIGTDVKNGRLKVHAIQNIGRATKNVYVSLPNIEALRGSSGAHLNTRNRIQSERMEIDGSSGAILNIEIDADDLYLEASSGANLDISGDTDIAQVEVSSGGNIDADDLQAKDCRAEASSGGNVKINVSESLVAEASSGGNISYSGQPKVSTKKSFSGSVTQRN